MRLFRTLTCLLFSFVTTIVSANAAQQVALAEMYRSAFEAPIPVEPVLELYDTLQRLSEEPRSLGDLQFVVNAIDKDETPASLKTSLDTINVLQLAVGGDMEGYKLGYARLRKAKATPDLLSTANIADLLEVCPSCDGDLQCDRCNGSLKCTKCKGRGKVPNTTSSGMSLSASSTVTCKTCKGSGACPTCKGSPKQCNVCHNSGKFPNEDRLYERIALLAGKLVGHLQKTEADILTTREQSRLLEADLRKAESISDLTAALAFLFGLPEERLKAAQAPHIAIIKAQIEDMLNEQAKNTATKQTQRLALRNEVQAAQRHPNPLKGMEALLATFEKYSDCDILPEAKTAFDGLVTAYQKIQAQEVEQLKERLYAIRLLKDPTDQIAQIEVHLATWEMPVASKALKDYAQAHHPTLTTVLSDTQLQAILADFQTELQTAQRRQQEALENQRSAWWIWAIIGLGGVILIYFIATVLQNLSARRQEAQRLARDRAVLDSIHKTFAHRCKH